MTTPEPRPLDRYVVEFEYCAAYPFEGEGRYRVVDRETGETHYHGGLTDTAACAIASRLNGRDYTPVFREKEPRGRCRTPRVS